jgi:hypothetical protein
MIIINANQIESIMNINMRKKTALALGSALIFFATTLNAQEQQWIFGVKTGSSMSWLRGLDELYPAKNKEKKGITYKASGILFPTVGFTAECAFHENVGVGLELLYAGLGGELGKSEKLSGTATAEGGGNSKLETVRIRSYNLVIPVTVKLFPMGCDPDEGILTVDLGAQAVIPLSVAFEKKGSGDKDKFEAVRDIDDKEIDKSKNVNRFTIGAIAGIGYEFPEIGLILEGRYHLGLMNFFKNDAEAKTYRKDKLGMEDGKNVTDHYATLSLGYNFARLLMD